MLCRVQSQLKIWFAFFQTYFSVGTNIAIYCPFECFFVFHRISFELHNLKIVYASYVKRSITHLDRKLLYALAHRSYRYSYVGCGVLMFTFKNFHFVWNCTFKIYLFLLHLAFTIFSVLSMWNKITEIEKLKGLYLIFWFKFVRVWLPIWNPFRKNK